jgi:predicted XRE-type DNA-binding protein
MTRQTSCSQTHIADFLEVSQIDGMVKVKFRQSVENDAILCLMVFADLCLVRPNS